MIKYSSLIEEMKPVNNKRRLVKILYLYSNLTYSTIYKIIGLYKNYLYQ